MDPNTAFQMMQYVFAAQMPQFWSAYPNIGYEMKINGAPYS